MGLSSNVLWHQTRKDAFFSILKTRRLLFSYSLEQQVPLPEAPKIAFPMISLSDVPFSELANTNWSYGKYAIGFKRKWGDSKGFSPVWYCTFTSRNYCQLMKMHEEAINANSKGLFGEVMYLFSNIKFVQSPLVTKDTSFCNYRFYDERENRLVPIIKETDANKYYPFLTEERYREYKEQHGNSLLDFGIDFNYDDVNYIIVENEDDIKWVNDILGDKANHVHVFTCEQVMQDFIGVSHNKEIIPSQEVLDMQASQRHLERIKKGFEEFLNKKRNKITLDQ